MWMLLALSAIAAEPVPAAPTRPVTIVQPSDAVTAVASLSTTYTRFGESQNFVVRSYLYHPRADEVARLCETLCCQMHQQLLRDDRAPEWQPKCEVVLHPTRASYLQAVGQGGSQTIGSSSIRIQSGRILQRRIDLMAEDRERALTALPHELTHVLFAELFPDTAPPRWAEEGLALLHDTDDKQGRHLNDLRYALQTKTTLPLERLFSTASYPSGWQQAVFYGQSMSVVEYLSQLDAPDQFVRFVELCTETDHVRALQTVYKIDSLDELERGWKQYALASISPGQVVE